MSATKSTQNAWKTSTSRRKCRFVQPPETSQVFEEASPDTEFRARKHHYFEMTSRLNWVAWIAATALVGGLLHLIMFDPANGRIVHFALLVMSFMLMIGPSFHSIISAIVGFLEPPGVD